MRVALVILRADASRGGAEKYTLDLAAALAERGHDATVLDAASLGAVGVTRVGEFRAFQRKLAAVRHGGDFDLVHAMLPVGRGMCDIYHPHAGVAAERSRPLSWWTNPRRRAFARSEREMLAAPDAPVTITLSDYVERSLRRHHPDLPADRTFRLFNGVDLARFTPDGPAADLPGEGPLALFVGNDFERKGLPTVLIALRDAAPWRLAVAGHDRRLQRRAADWTRQLGVADRVTFLGPRRDAPDLYRAADVLVHASRHDPCSLATLEALASGLPVIGGANDGAMEVVAEGEHGHVLAASGGQATADELAGRLRSLADPAPRRRMSEACITLRPQLSWDAHVDRLVGLYKSVLSRSVGKTT